MRKIKHIFLGSLCRGGFVSHIGELVGDGSPYTVYIIKGSSGSGKSTIIKRVLARLESEGIPCTAVHCSSDPSSLDGVICSEKGFCILDGTAPHAVEPSLLYGKHRVVALYRYMDVARLSKNARQICELLEQGRALRQDAQRHLSAAGELAEQAYLYARRALNEKKLTTSFTALSKRILIGGDGGGDANIFFNAVTPRGLCSFFDENKSAIKTRIILNDSGMAAASRALETVAREALARGIGVIKGVSPLSDSITEYIELPSLGTALFANTPFSHCVDSHAKSVNMYRFYDATQLKETRVKATLCKRLAMTLTDEAAESLAAAQTAHMRIEGFYKSCVDFDAQRAESERLIAELFQE